VTADKVPVLLDAILGETTKTTARTGVPLGDLLIGSSALAAGSRLGGRSVPGRASVLRASDAVGAGQRRRDRSIEHDEYIAFGRVQGVFAGDPRMTPLELCKQVEESACEPGGGGSSPARSGGSRWARRPTRSSSSATPTGDPGAFMDRAIIEATRTA